MGGRFSRGWELLKQSWGVLRQDKALLLFPVLSFMACLLVLLSFVLPLVFVPGLGQQFLDDAQVQQGRMTNTIMTYAWLFVFYFVNFAIIVFFNSALVACAVIRFNGGAPTVGDGLRAAGSRLPQILGWAFLAATVGVILRFIEDRVSFVGKFIIGLIGLAWTIATYFVVPVLVVERVGPFGAVRRSTAILKKTWGESLTGGISISLVGFVLALPGIALLLVGVFAAIALKSMWLAIVVGAIAIVYFIVLSIVLSTLQQIFIASVYLYAGQGVVPAGFEEETLKTAFMVKK